MLPLPGSLQMLAAGSIFIDVPSKSTVYWIQKEAELSFKQLNNSGRYFVQKLILRC